MTNRQGFGLVVLLVGLLLAPSVAQGEVKMGMKFGNRIIEELGTNGEVTKSTQLKGASVVEVLKNGVAEQLKLQKGDLIRAVATPTLGKRRVDHVAHLVWVLKKSTKDVTQVYYYRGDTLYVTRLVVREVLVDVQEMTKVDGSNQPPRTRKQKVNMLVPESKRASEKDFEDAKPAGD